MTASDIHYCIYDSTRENQCKRIALVVPALDDNNPSDFFGTGPGAKRLETYIDFGEESEMGLGLLQRFGKGELLNCVRDAKDQPFIVILCPRVEVLHAAVAFADVNDGWTRVDSFGSVPINVNV